MAAIWTDGRRKGSSDRTCNCISYTASRAVQIVKKLKVLPITQAESSTCSSVWQVTTLDLLSAQDLSFLSALFNDPANCSTVQLQWSTITWVQNVGGIMVSGYSGVLGETAVQCCCIFILLTACSIDITPTSAHRYNKHAVTWCTGNRSPLRPSSGCCTSPQRPLLGCLSTTRHLPTIQTHSSFSF